MTHVSKTGPRTLGALLAALGLIAMFAMPVAADAPNDCPDPLAGDFADASTAAGETGSFVIDGTTVYYEVSEDGKTISFFSDEDMTQPLEVEFCVKGGSLANSGVKIASSYTVDFLNDGGQTPAISNFVVYSVPVPGTLTIIKQTNPDATAGTFNFSAMLGGVAQPAFSLSDGQSKIFTGNGTYVINETGLPAASGAGTWALTDINCGSATVTETATGVTVTVTANAAISCTFTNTLTPPSITLTPTLSLEKVVTSGSGDTDFSFSLNGGAAMLVSANDAPVLLASAAGTYTIAEAALANWSFNGIDCTGNATAEVVTAATRSVSITVGADEDVVCTFTNSPSGTLSGNPTPSPTPAGAVAPTRSGTLGGTLPNTAMDSGSSDGTPAVLLAIVGLAGLVYLGRRNVMATKQRS